MELNDDHCIANREQGFAIETERLILYPTANESMELLIAAEHDAEMKQAYSEMLQGCVQNPNERIWYAVWYIELKNSPRTIVGDFCFKGLNADGTVEIGYGLYDGCCGRGYMTEALSRLQMGRSPTARKANRSRNCSGEQCFPACTVPRRLYADGCHRGRGSAVCFFEYTKQLNRIQ